MEKALSRYQAVLIGGAIGDTLGMPVEGWHRDQIERYLGGLSEPIDPVRVKDQWGNTIFKDETGPIPYISAHKKRGQTTDDSDLFVATSRSIVEVQGLDLANLAKHSLIIYAQSLSRQLQMSEDQGTYKPFGKTTTAGFENLKRGVPPSRSGVMSKYPGNAPVTRNIPVGMYMHATGEYEEGLEFAQAAGKMTHLDPRSIVAGIVQAQAIYSLLSGVGCSDFLDSMVDICSKWERSTEQDKKVTLLKRLEWVSHNKDQDSEAAYGELGPGWSVTKNYPFTLFMFQKYWDDPIEGLKKLVNYGGDCDSTGAMYGALAGAKHGMIFPKPWVRILENRQELKSLASGIFDLKKNRQKIG